MFVNGQMLSLVPRFSPKLQVWGVKESTGTAHGLWVNESGGGWTTSIDFHGRQFQTKEAAQAYVDGYNQARREVKRALGGVRG